MAKPGSSSFSKQIKNKAQQDISKAEVQATPSDFVSEKPPFSWNSFAGYSIILMILSLVLYGNTLFNDIALDDGLVYTKNNLVTKGFAGIWDIISHDSFYGAFGDTYSLNGGRYRPLSLVTFAIEYQIIGIVPWFSHLINILLYGFTGILLMRFFKDHVFKAKASFKPYETPFPLILSFFVAFLFIIHPIHTEVVANIKSRDEILSLIFLLLTLHYTLKHIKLPPSSQRTGTSSDKPMAKFYLLFAVLCYVLAMLAKENGLTFVFIIPVTLYFFSKAKPSKIFVTALPFIAVVVAYLLFRVVVLGFQNMKVTELLDNPYLLATTGERFATIFFCFLQYFRLLIFPHPLTYDYSWNQVPYRHFGDIAVIISVIIHLALAYYVLKNWKKKDPLVWCILFYMAGIFIVSNMVMNVGTFIAERFLFQGSIVFCLAVVILVDKAFSTVTKENMKRKLQFAILLSVILFIPAAAKTITRNADWKNDSVLFLHDVNISTGSARAYTYAAVRLSTDADTFNIPMQQLKARIDSVPSEAERTKLREEFVKDSVTQLNFRLEGLKMCEKSNSIYPNSPSNFFNWGVIYSRLDSVEKAEEVWNKARDIKPNSTLLASYDKYMSEVFFKRGLSKGLSRDNQHNLTAAIADLNKATRYDSTNAEYWYNLGGAYFTNQQYDSAKYCWERTIYLKPDHTQAKQGLAALVPVNVGH